ncbi:hypothetical protein ACPDHL_15560 [Myroides sp. C15-4]|uniref:hypothetical protein n=1 Tax=Myroides sp. C15-4 TaxID=3400532 RepID=UPI003D2F99E7
MKKIIVSAVVAFTVLTTTNTFAQQGFGTNTPDRSAAVDIVSNKRGLLIPRIAIPNLDQAAPVAKPANALMVYNTGTADTAAGFYYWDAAYNNNTGRWVRFVSSNSGSAVTVSAGTNVTVKPTPDGHDMDYNVSVKGGDVAGQVLVTEIVNINGETVQTTKWVNPQDFINGSVVGENGITTEIGADGKVHVSLGGTPIETATVLDVSATDASLAITGLDVLDGTAGKEFDAAKQNIVIMGSDGILKVVTPKALLEEVITEGVNGKALTSSSISVDTNGATALLKDVNIEITAGDSDGLVMVTKVDAAGKKTTEWRSPADLSNTLEAGQGISIDGDNKINLGGNPITTPTVLDIEDANASLAIKGLPTLEDKDAVVGHKVVMADENGVLKETSPENLIGEAIDGGNIEAKALKGVGITVTAGGVVGTDLAVANSVLKDVTLGIADGAVTAEKMTANVGADNAPKGAIPVANADGTVTYQQITGELLNGKALTSGSISVFGGKNALLDATRIDITGGTAEGDVLVTSDQPLLDENGDAVKDANNKTVYVTKWVSAADLGNTVTASNGLTKEDNNIKLGGDITETTTLNVGTGGSLAINGLGTADKAKTNQVVVVQADGKLATIDKAEGDVIINQEGNVNISDNTVVNNYHPSMEEIVIEVVLKNDDTNLILPAIDGTAGQTISIKIVNTDDLHGGYLNIKTDATTTLVYGAMPYQGWIIKSNGTKWIVVGRN